MIIDVRIARMVEEDPNIDEEVAIGRLIREVLTPEKKGHRLVSVEGLVSYTNRWLWFLSSLLRWELTGSFRSS